MNALRTEIARFVFATREPIDLAAEQFVTANDILSDEVTGNGWPLPKGLKFRRVADHGDVAVYVRVPDAEHRCDKVLECGSSCWLPRGHHGPCLCGGDVDGEPGTCPA